MEAVRKEEGAPAAAAALEALGKGLGPQTPPDLRGPIARLLADTILGKLLVLAGDGLVALQVGEGLLRELLPVLLDGLRPCRAVGRRCWSSGLLALLCPTLGGPEGLRVGPALGGALRDTEPSVRANALCAVGRLPLWAPGRALVLRALCEEGPGRVRDNACAALVRNWEHWESPEALGLLLRALPISEDLEEESPVLEGLLRLHRGHPHALWPHAAELPRACANAVGSDRLSPELREALLSLLREVWGGCPTAFQEGLHRLPHGEAQRLRQALEAVGP
ncbi:importin-4-like [Cuculus canorus]|uniref:importin-4-like n=1 Tax=Cuculus canorus TaxID=55661 RepID=UPI0023AA5B80|nr:importin-4-like [Cuculus canorus]